MRRFLLLAGSVLCLSSALLLLCLLVEAALRFVAYFTLWAADSPGVSGSLVCRWAAVALASLIHLFVLPNYHATIFGGIDVVGHRL